MQQAVPHRRKTKQEVGHTLAGHNAIAPIIEYIYAAIVRIEHGQTTPWWPGL